MKTTNDLKTIVVKIHTRFSTVRGFIVIGVFLAMITILSATTLVVLSYQASTPPIHITYEELLPSYWFNERM